MYGGAVTMFYSYVMGIGDEILDLENKGFNINQYGNDYGVTFPSDKADVWEQFISHHLELAIGMNILLTIKSFSCFSFLMD